MEFLKQEHAYLYAETLNIVNKLTTIILPLDKGLNDFNIEIGNKENLFHVSKNILISQMNKEYEDGFECKEELEYFLLSMSIAKNITFDKYLKVVSVDYSKLTEVVEYFIKYNLVEFEYFGSSKEQVMEEIKNDDTPYSVSDIIIDAFTFDETNERKENIKKALESASFKVSFNKERIEDSTSCIIEFDEDNIFISPEFDIDPSFYHIDSVVNVLDLYEGTDHSID